MRLRFLLYVVIAALIPPVLAFVATGDVAGQTESVLEQRVTAELRALEARLDADASKRRELLLRLVEQPEIRELVRDIAKSDSKPSAASVVKVREAVNQLFRKDVPELPELIAVVNQAGAQVVVHSGEPKDFAVEELAGAGAALSGQPAVTYARFDNAFYRLSAEPVGISDGVIIVGDRIGDSTAVRLRELIRADVTFVVGSKPIVSSLKPVDVRNQAAEAAKHPSKTHPSGDIELRVPGWKFLKKVFPLMVPHSAYRSLAKDLQGAAAVVTIRSDLEWMAKTQLEGIAIGLFLLIVGLFWLRVVYGPTARQARSIESHIARLRADRTLRLGLKGFSSPFKEISVELDKLADEWIKETPPPIMPFTREVSAPHTTATEVPKPVIQRPPVELPLGSTPAPVTPETPEGTPAFPFQDDPHVKTGKNRISPATLPPKEPTPMKPAESEQPTKPTVKPITKPFEAPKPIEPTFAEAKAETRPSITSTFAASNVSGPDEPMGGPVPLPGGPRNNMGLQKPVIAASKPAMPTSGGEPDLPPELLARSQELERELLDPPADPDEEHYRSVFDEFLTVRRRCGEGNDGLTFDKFSLRLKKNRDQLIEKYACRTVRFQVYVKEGKAAVKAVPVR